MTNYVKSTNFLSKDSLASGNPAKTVKGSELDTEFNNIAVAVATKADSASPTFTGTPLAPTPSFGDDSTKISTTAFVQAALQALYPVGSIYINASSSTNPATLFGFGTWTAFGAGRVLVGLDSGDTSFDTLEETGGSKDAIVVSHTHSITDPGHSHSIGSGSAGNQVPSFGSGPAIATPTSTTTGTSTTGISIGSSGSSGTNANLQPYVVVKMWKRTA